MQALLQRPSAQGITSCSNPNPLMLKTTQSPKCWPLVHVAVVLKGNLVTGFITSLNQLLADLWDLHSLSSKSQGTVFAVSAMSEYKECTRRCPHGQGCLHPTGLGWRPPPSPQPQPRVFSCCCPAVPQHLVPLEILLANKMYLRKNKKIFNLLSEF